MKKRWIVYSIGVVVLGGIITYVVSSRGGGAPSYEPATVARGDVTNIVSVTGHIEPVTRVMLSFPVGGQVRSLPVPEGTRVAQGAVVARLDNDASASALAKAQAQSARERAVLRELIAPLRKEERAVKDATVVSRERALARAEDTAWAAVSQAFVYADDAVRENAYELFDDASGSTPSLGITFTYGTTRYMLQADNETKAKLITERQNITDILTSMKARTRDSGLSVDEALAATEHDLVAIQDFLNTLADVVNAYTPANSSEQTVYEAFQTSVSTARTAVNSAWTVINTARSTYDAAGTALASAIRDLDLAEAVPQADAVAAQEAAVLVAERAVDSARAQVSNTILTAPFSGTVTSITPTVGESVSPYEPVVELLTEGAYEIQTYVPEADIARLRLGDQATVTFDAFERTDVFNAEVIRIALSETVREGVPTYKTTLVLKDTPDSSLILRPGMTANVDITTDVRTDVLYVPTRTLTTDAGRTYVKMWNGSTFVEREVTTGLRGSEGTTEITSGLTKGEEIVLFVEGL